MRGYLLLGGARPVCGMLHLGQWQPSGSISQPGADARGIHWARLHYLCHEYAAAKWPDTY
jgi:hypothetical protein